ncbi:unnamed protein product [Lepidochelys kempii]
MKLGKEPVHLLIGNVTKRTCLGLTEPFLEEAADQTSLSAESSAQALLRCGTALLGRHPQCSEQVGSSLWPGDLSSCSVCPAPSTVSDEVLLQYK